VKRIPSPDFPVKNPDTYSLHLNPPGWHQPEGWYPVCHRSDT